MKRRDLDELELGRRAAFHLTIDNELRPGARVEAIAWRMFAGTNSKDWKAR